MDRCMKVCLLIDLAGNTNGIGTTYRILETLSESIPHTIRFIISKSIHSKMDLGDSHISHVEYGNGSTDSLSRGTPFLINYYQSWRVIHDLNPDILHIATPGPLGMMGLIYGTMYNRPTIYFRHICLPSVTDILFRDYFSNSIIPKFMYFIDRIFISNTDAQIVYKGSKSLTQESYTKYYDVHDGVESDFFNAPKNTLDVRDYYNLNEVSFSQTDKCIGYLGRYSYEKNIPLLVKISKIINNINVISAGEGPLKYLIDSSPNILDIGVLGRYQVRLFLNYIDALVLPSKSEQYGKVALEAMACGTPVFMTEHVGIAQTLQRGQHYFHIPDDPYMSANIIQNVLKDEHRLNLVGRRARMEVIDRDYSHMFQSLIKIWEELYVRQEQ
jgi:glycosyltransferase involved in cell wall biosynthesis